MKQVALGRKNWMFIGSVAAGERAADLIGEEEVGAEEFRRGFGLVGDRWRRGPSAPTDLPRLLLTVRDVGSVLGISPRQVWKLNSTGRLLAPLRLSRSVR